jgi:hypothetical protein
MSLSNYVKGDLVRLSAVFTVSGVATDPTTVTCTVRDPGGTETTPAATKDSIGNYHVDVDLTSAKSGVWQYEFLGTGACQAAMVGEFFVEPNVF